MRMTRVIGPIATGILCGGGFLADSAISGANTMPIKEALAVAVVAFSLTVYLVRWMQKVDDRLSSIEKHCVVCRDAEGKRGVKKQP